MSTETLSAIGQTIVGSSFFKDDTTLVWHAGEPCVLSPDWYRQAIDLLEAASGRDIPRQALQTNATLLSPDWIAFIQQSSISVGVSLDGPASIHNAHRVTRSGVGTYAQTMDGIKMLRKAEIPFHIIAVVTAQALAQPEVFARSLADTGAFSIGLNIEEIDGVNEASSLFSAKPDAAFSEFLMRFMDTIEAMADPPKIREYDRFLAALRNDDRGTRHMENSPGAILSVGRTGDISTFSPELLGTPSASYNDFVFGNVHNINDVARVFLNRAYLHALKDIQKGVTTCRKNCAYFGVCGGGSPSNKLGETGRLDSTETAFCRLSVKSTFDSFLKRSEHAA